MLKRYIIIYIYIKFLNIFSREIKSYLTLYFIFVSRKKIIILKQIFTSFVLTNRYEFLD